MSWNALLKYLPYVIASIFVIYPIVVTNEMWDGRLIEYAASTQNYMGMRSMFLESNWITQYWLTVGMIETAEALGSSYRAVNDVVVAILFLCLIRECLLLASQRLQLTLPWTALCGTLIASFPGWTVLISSIMTIHVVCVTLGLLAVRLIHAPRIWQNVLGFVLAVPALNYQSLLTFLPALSYLYDATQSPRHRIGFLKLPSLRTGLVFALCVACFLVVKIAFPPQGIYANYNQIVLTDLQGLWLAIYAVLRFGTWLAPFTIVAAGLLIWLALVVRKQANGALRFDDSMNSLAALAALVFMHVCAVLPYAAAGKFTYLWDDHGWDLRHAIPLAIPAAMLSAFVLQHLARAIPASVQAGVPLTLACVLLVAPNLALLARNNTNKLWRQNFDTRLMEVMKQRADALPPGLLQIVGEGIPARPQLADYESNYLMYLSSGVPRWWTHIGATPTANFDAPAYVQAERKYQVQRVFDYDRFGTDCHTTVVVSASGFETAAEAFRQLFGIESRGTIAVRSTESTCGAKDKTSAERR